MIGKKMIINVLHFCLWSSIGRSNCCFTVDLSVLHTSYIGGEVKDRGQIDNDFLA